MSELQLPSRDELDSAWRHERLYDICDIRTSNVDKKSQEDQQWVRLCNYVDVYHNERITSEIPFMEATASENEIERFTLGKGDVVITKDSESADDIGVPAVVAEVIDQLVCGYHLTVLRPDTTQVVGPFLNYALSSRLSSHQFHLAANGVTRFGLTYQGTKNVRIFVPPLAEQERIASFLDWKTGEIDRLIAKKRALISALAEKRMAVITQAVTRGLDPNAPLKETGIPWLGKVPEHWDTVPLGFLVSISGGMTPSTGNPAFWKGEIPWVTPKDMKQERVEDSIDHLTEDALAENSITLKPIGSVLCVVRGMILAHSFPVAINDQEVTINQDMKALQCESRLQPEFLHRCLMGFADVFVALADTSAHGTKKIVTGTLKSFVVPVPPIKEQGEIVERLLHELRRLDVLVDSTNRTIDRLTEYRTALITAATTGKIDVRNVDIPVA